MSACYANYQGNFNLHLPAKHSKRQTYVKYPGARNGRVSTRICPGPTKDDDLEIIMSIPKLLTSRKNDTLNFIELCSNLECIYCQKNIAQPINILHENILHVSKQTMGPIFLFLHNG
jgi:hypothetical protein